MATTDFGPGGEASSGDCVISSGNAQADGRNDAPYFWVCVMSELDLFIAVNQDVWAFAELGLEEHRSAARLAGVLRKAGFEVKEGVSGMPTAFKARLGWSGRAMQRQRLYEREKRARARETRQQGEGG